jgi:hypothetical protein
MMFMRIHLGQVALASGDFSFALFHLRVRHP